MSTMPLDFIVSGRQNFGLFIKADTLNEFDESFKLQLERTGSEPTTIVRTNTPFTIQFPRAVRPNDALAFYSFDGRLPDDATSPSDPYPFTTLDAGSQPIQLGDFELIRPDRRRRVA